MPEKSKILSQASLLFMQYGIKSISMDDLARELGISKKTIYQHFESKTALVNAAFKAHLKQMEEIVLEFLDKKELNAIEQILGLAEMHQNLLSQMKPTVLFDIQKYYKDSWNLVEEHKENFVKKIIENNLTKGIEEGLYRPELNAKVLSIFYRNQITALTDSKQFSINKYELPDIHKAFINFYIHGIASDKGRSFLTNHN